MKGNQLCFLSKFEQTLNFNTLQSPICYDSYVLWCRSLSTATYDLIYFLENIGNMTKTGY